MFLKLVLVWDVVLFGEDELIWEVDDCVKFEEFWYLDGWEVFLGDLYIDGGGEKLVICRLNIDFDGGVGGGGSGFFICFIMFWWGGDFILLDEDVFKCVIGVVFSFVRSLFGLVIGLGWGCFFI